MIILGVDPGLQRTGWGLIRKEGSNLKFIDAGTLTSDNKRPLAERLLQLHDTLLEIITHHKPDAAAIEETFVNVNPSSTLKLGQARGALLMTLSLAGLDVHEYAATQVKKTVVGVGRADKNQIQMMVEMLLPASKGKVQGADAADALAIAICHAHHAVMKSKLA
jgi:crossover junction endodeoxyribonuclease RuvC